MPPFAKQEQHASSTKQGKVQSNVSHSHVGFSCQNETSQLKVQQIGQPPIMIPSKIYITDVKLLLLLLFCFPRLKEGSMRM